jgi:hypothetical protein
VRNDKTYDSFKKLADNNNDLEKIKLNLIEKIIIMERSYGINSISDVILDQYLTLLGNFIMISSLVINSEMYNLCKKIIVEHISMFSEYIKRNPELREDIKTKINEIIRISGIIRDNY